MKSGGAESLTGPHLSLITCRAAQLDIRFSLGDISAALSRSSLPVSTAILREPRDIGILIFRKQCTGIQALRPRVPPRTDSNWTEWSLMKQTRLQHDCGAHPSAQGMLAQGFDQVLIQSQLPLHLQFQTQLWKRRNMLPTPTILEVPSSTRLSPYSVNVRGGNRHGRRLSQY